MKKVLKLEYMRIPEGFTSRDSCVIWKVTEQSHRKENFGHGDSTWEASNGVVLKSVDRPGWYEGDTVFMRGDNRVGDSTPVTMSGGFFQRILLAVREYNATEFEER